MTWPLQYRIDRIPPASSSAISILPTNIVFPNSASSGNTLRVDSKRRPPTATDDSPRSSPGAFRRAIGRPPAGGGRSMSSAPPGTPGPRAPRPAASVPASVIHCIIRPPWIWPGAPACSGNAHWTISTTESAIDGIRALYHLVPRARASSAGFADAAFERGVRAPAFADAIDSIGGFGRGAKPPPSASAPAALGSFDRDGVEVVEARRLQAQPTHACPRERPVEAHVDRQPRQLLSEQDLGALVEPLPLGAKRELAGADQQAVELGIPVKGEVQGAWPLDRRLARRQREQEQVGVAPRHRRLEERQVVVAPLEDRACRVGRLESEGEVDALSGERGPDGLGHLGKVHRRRLRRHEQRRPQALGPAALGEQRLHRAAASAEDGRALPPRPHARRQERLERDRGALERYADDHRIERGGPGLAHLSSGEGHLLGLEREVADAEAGKRERALGAPRRR